MPKDSDLEDATPVTPEMGTIELKAYRCKVQGKATRASPLHRMREDPHRGRVSEQSKKAGWHHVAYVPSVESSFPWSPLTLLLIDPSSFGEEIPINDDFTSVEVNYLDSLKGPPHASFKIFYRPRGKPDVLS